MTAPSPVQVAGATASFTIKANGTAIDGAWQVLSVDIWTGVNKLPKARVVLYDGSAATESFPISASSAFVPGAKLEISLGYDSKETVLFTGLVFRLGLEISENDASRLVVEATDKAMAMTLARHNAIYENITDSALIEKLIGNAGLAKNVTSTSAQQPTIVQYYSTDWDLMVIRAQLNSMVVMVEAAKVTVAPPDTAAAPVLTLTFGDSILDFQAELDASTQYAASAMKSYAWDPATQKLASSGTASANVTEAGNLSSATLAKVFNVSLYPQQTGGELPTADLTAWSSGALLKSKLSKIRGMVAFQGSPLAKMGNMVTLAGVGDRFNGNVYVAAVHHNLTEGFWKTTLEFGLPFAWFSATAPDIPAPGAAGQLPPVGNLQTGIVQKLDQDPEGEFRVYVTLPLLQATGTLGVWARLGSFYASNGIGAEFYPEIGDEVVVAFMNDDPRFPVIVASLYSKKYKPPVPPAAANNQKTIVTRSKLRLDFFEDKKAVEISTPGGHNFRMDEDAKTITLKDLKGNKLTMAPEGITIESAGKMTLNAKGDIAINSQANISVSAAKNVDISGLSISESAQKDYAAEGANTTLKGKTAVTIQGAMVKIN
ncbi:type VI secretion system tip protein VgrG [Niveispirillum sp. SYP-B3756]|uniref:type VI secretion system tip protein VgrG n=1 Tax=Niveispirillum sp. SYP-B3756 TaxID=2662178 RepID=UPI0012918AA7|nr:type VI secretion system tip protein VgrG [Niveispirillum sp. SYP-B3756]MQP66373.1 type VI secretion system tip protein VgrG [Niveispirillum sp. SYP-B3756]